MNPIVTPWTGSQPRDTSPQAVPHLVGRPVSECQQNDLPRKQAAPLAQVHAFGGGCCDYPTFERRWSFGLREEPGGSLILGEIVLDDAIDDGAGLPCARSSINYDMSIQIQCQPLCCVQAHQKSSSILTWQALLTEQYLHTPFEGVGCTLPEAAPAATPRATDRRWASHALRWSLSGEGGSSENLCRLAV